MNMALKTVKTKKGTEIKSGKKTIAMTELNPQQLKFCQNYTSLEFLGNGTKAYADAYGVDVNKKNGYQVANVGAQRLLQHEACLKMVNILLDEKGLNDVTVDKHLLFVIQQGADLNAKVSGIKEYNKLRSRVTKKLDVTVGQKYDYSRLSNEELDTFLQLAQKAIV
jgi:hypothetical protein